MTTSLENPLSSLSSGYFSDSTTFKVKQTIEDIQGRCTYRVFEKIVFIWNKWNIYYLSKGQLISECLFDFPKYHPKFW